MKYQLSLRDWAEQDILKAMTFYENQQIGLGAKFHDEVALALPRIATNPFMYAAVGRPRYRKAVMNAFPFAIYYCVEQTRIFVIAVHDSRRGTPWDVGRV